MVMYDDDDPIGAKTISRPNTSGRNGPPPPVAYAPPPDTMGDAPEVGAGTSVWTVEGDKEKALGEDGEDLSDNEDGDDSTKILLEKEFDDFYEDQVHKAAGPVVFVSKVLGMLPAIWTEDENESECKSYFNLYTFVLFIGWIGLAVVSGIRTGKVDSWPAENYTMNDPLHPKRFISRGAADTYVASLFTAALVALIFGVFKCRSFAEILFGLSETDGQLELREKHYEKIKRKSLYWIAFLVILLAGHAAAFFMMLDKADMFDLVFYVCDILAHCVLFVLDLQFLYFCMVLCKRYRLVNKILVHITKPWKTFRNVQPPNYILQNILQYRFDQFFDPSADSNALMAKHAANNKGGVGEGSAVSLEQLLKVSDEPKVTKEEENTFIMQLDILRGIHADLATLANEVNHLLGFQILVQIITSVVHLILFGYFFSASALDGSSLEDIWPYLVLAVLPAIRLLLIGHWGQVMEQQSRQPFMTICQVSTIDGSPRLERQVQKLSIQMHHQCPNLTAAGFFNIGRNMILKAIGLCVLFTFFMVQFSQNTDKMSKMTPTPAPSA